MMAFMLMTTLGFLWWQAPDSQMTLSLLNDDFLKWAFRALIAAGAGYLWRDHAHQKKQDEAILRLEHAMSLNHPSKADFEAYQLRQENILIAMREEIQTVDRIVRMMAAKQNIDVRV